jgi:hypothetical protein
LADSEIDHYPYARDIVVGSNPPHCNREEFVSFYIAGIQQEGAPKEKRLMVSERGEIQRTSPVRYSGNWVVISPPAKIIK